MLLKNFFSDLSSYFYDLFVDGLQRVFAFFTILGIILYFYPDLPKWLTDHNIRIFGVIISFAYDTKIIGTVIFLFSFLIANFSLYRRLKEKISKISESSIRIYPYSNRRCDSIKIHYVGPERAKNLEVRKLYKNPQGQEVSVEVTEFFPENDLEMVRGIPKINILEPDQVLHFHLVKKQSTPDGKVTVWVRLTGVESGKTVEIRRDFPLRKNGMGFG